MDELKIRIWDYLFQVGQSVAIDRIASELGETVESIQQCVDDPWFVLKDGHVGIAQQK